MSASSQVEVWCKIAERYEAEGRNTLARYWLSKAIQHEADWGKR